MGAPPAAGPRVTGRPLVRGSVLAVLAVVTLFAVAGCGDGLPDKGTVAGTVVDANDAPRKSCRITRTVEGTNPYPLTDEAADTDGDGGFRWEMYPGAYLITAVCPDGTRELRGISTVDVSSGTDTPVRIVVR